MKNIDLNIYQNKFAQFVGAKHARATMLGRQALFLLLKALDVKNGDNVGVCAFTCLSVVEAITVAGAKPVFLDIDEHLTINPSEISKQRKNSIKVIILQHTFGNPGKLDELVDACNSINALIIEDCAHALGCYWKEKHLGQFSQGAIFSFQWGKPYTTGQGGMVVFNSEEIAKTIDTYTENYGTKQSCKEAVALVIQRIIRSLLITLGIEYQVRSLLKSIKKKPVNNTSLSFKTDCEEEYIKIPDILTIREGLKYINNYHIVQELRRKNTEYIEYLLHKKKIDKLPRDPVANLTLLRYPLLVKDKQEKLQVASRKGWDVAGWYDSPVHPLTSEQLEIVGYTKGSAPNAEKLIKQLIHLPTINITKRKLRLIIETLFKVSSRK